MNAIAFLDGQGLHDGFDVVCFHQRRKVLEPETGSLLFGMTKHPGLYGLGLGDVSNPLLSVFVHDGIFDSDTGHRSV